MPENESIVDRLRATASRGTVEDCTLDLLSAVHVLDLAEDGLVLAHI